MVRAGLHAAARAVTFTGAPSLGTSVASDASSPECVIAIARALLASSAVLIVAFEPTEPHVYSETVQGLLSGYAALAALLLPITCGTNWAFPRRGLVFLACDLAFGFLVTLLTQGPASPFFPFLIFAVITSAYRWGPNETLQTAAGGAAMLVAEGVLVGTGPLSINMATGTFEWSRALAYILYIAVIGLLLAIVAEREEQRRREAAVVASVTSQAGMASSPDATFEALMAVVLRTWRSKRALLVLQEVATDRVFRWDVQLAPGTADATLTRAQIGADERAACFFDVPGPSWHALRVRPGSEWFELVAIGQDGRRVPTVIIALPASFPGAKECHGVLGTSVSFGDEWTGRLFLIDPAIGSSREAALRLGQLIARRIAPAAHRAYVLGTLRAGAADVERQRLARELHDGVVQSLVAAEIEVDLLRRRAATEAPQLVDALSRIQVMLRGEARGVRELTAEMKVAQQGPLGAFTEIVSRFERESGIETRFVSEAGVSTIPRRASHEISRILQEALVNVRKHSGARHVMVRAATTNGTFRLSIEDDGRGFPFNGRLSSADLKEQQHGPKVIMERARALGGNVIVESSPGRGARVEVAVRLEG